MKLLKTSTLLGLLATAASAYAIEYKDADVFGGGAGVIIAPGATFSDTFSITASDGTTYFQENTAYYSAGREFFSTDPSFFTPGAEEITSGSASFWLRDTAGDGFMIDLEMVSFFNQVTSGVDSATVAKSLKSEVKAALNIDGTITYTIKNNGPTDIVLDYAYMKVVAAPVVGVPDGGTTALLLGLGFLGLASGRRAKKFRK
jgi:hypothetical protein